MLTAASLFTQPHTAQRRGNRVTPDERTDMQTTDAGGTPANARVQPPERAAKLGAPYPGK